MGHRKPGASDAGSDSMCVSTPLQERLTLHAAKLTAADRRIWAELSRDPTLAVFQSTEAIADHAGVNQASVVRFAQKLGYPGFVAMRDAMRETVRDTTSPKQRLRKLVDGPSSGRHSVTRMLNEQADALDRAAIALSDPAFEQAADALAEASRIFVFASGHATALAELSVRRLARIGCCVIDLRGSARDIIERVADIGQGDALLAFGFRTQPRHLAPLLDLAAERDAHIVALTDVLAPDMARAQAIVLAASRGRIGDYQTLTVPLAIMEALAIAVATRRPARATESLDRIGDVAKRFDTPSSSRSASAPVEKRRKRNRD